MFDPVNPTLVPSQALQFNALASAEMSRVSQPYVQRGQAQSVEPATLAPIVEPSRPNPVEISRVLLNAESMIAAVMGLKTYEVSVIVNTGRYGGF